MLAKWIVAIWTMLLAAGLSGAPEGHLHDPCVGLLAKDANNDRLKERNMLHQFILLSGPHIPSLRDAIPRL